MIGKNPEGDLSPFRRKIIRSALQYGPKAILLNKLIVPRRIEPEIDYSYYLGPNYKNTYKKPKGKVPTYVANHTSGIDILTILTTMNADVGFLSGSFLKQFPLIGLLVICG